LRHVAAPRERVEQAEDGLLVLPVRPAIRVTPILGWAAERLDQRQGAIERRGVGIAIDVRLDGGERNGWGLGG